MKPAIQKPGLSKPRLVGIAGALLREPNPLDFTVPFTSNELDSLSEFLKVAATAMSELAATHERLLPGSALVERLRIYAEQAMSLRARIEAR